MPAAVVVDDSNVRNHAEMTAGIAPPWGWEARMLKSRACPFHHRAHRPFRHPVGLRPARCASRVLPMVALGHFAQLR